MSSRATKRQKRTASPSGRSASYDVTTDADSEPPADEEEDEEEQIRSASRRAATKHAKNAKKPATPTKKKPATPTKKNATAAASGRRQLASRQKRPERGGLRQSEISFSKAVPITPSPQKSASIGAQEAKEKENNGELEDDLIQDEDEEVSRRRPSFIAPGSRQASFVSTTSQGSEKSLLRRPSGKHTPFSTPSLGQGFQKKAAAAAAAAVQDANADLPWAQRYSPRSLDELGVHKRKVADVRGWLDNVLKGYEKKRLLVLRGPSGAGKTATVQTLAGELGFSILEWKNPLANTSATGEYSSNTTSLEDFLSRGQRYGSLDFENGAMHDTSPEESKSADNARRIILIEELPHVFGSNSTSLRNFRESILRYLLAEESFFSARDAQRARPPIVLIISEAASSSSTSPTDSLTAHRVLGPEILQHPRVTPIEFNPVATTILAKALEQVLKRATAEGAAATQVSPAILHKLAERGDLRAGILALEFMCLARPSSERPRPVATKRSKANSGKNAVLTTSEAALMDAVAQRSTMLDLFHAVGKVMYNKRTASGSDAGAMVSEVDVDALLDDSGTEPGTFVAALHENYALSCAGDAFIDTLNASTEALSASDVLAGSATTGIFSYGGGGSDAAAAIRQADLAAHVAVQGLLHGLPYPVKRANVASRDSFKMFWPESLRVRGRADEVLATAQRFVGQTPNEREDPMQSARPCDRSAIEALLLDVPYRALIADANKSASANTALLKQLATMANLQNSRWAAASMTAEEQNERSPNRKRDLWKKKTSPKKKTSRNEDPDDDGMGSFIRGVDEKWVLSDDDIED